MSMKVFFGRAQTFDLGVRLGQVLTELAGPTSEYKIYRVRILSACWALPGKKSCKFVVSQKVYQYFSSKLPITGSNASISPNMYHSTLRKSHKAWCKFVSNVIILKEIVPHSSWHELQSITCGFWNNLLVRLFFRRQ